MVGTPRTPCAQLRGFSRGELLGVGPDTVVPISSRLASNPVRAQILTARLGLRVCACPHARRHAYIGRSVCTAIPRVVSYAAPDASSVHQSLSVYPVVSGCTVVYICRALGISVYLSDVMSLCVCLPDA